jgi:hypothetical protein
LFLNEIFKRTNASIAEGGNATIGGATADAINLQVHNRGFMVPLLNTLLLGINSSFKKLRKKELWNAQVLQNREFLSGSSLHFFDTNIPDEEFTRVKPRVGDIDTQVDKTLLPDLQQFLTAIQGKQIGGATFIGYDKGNEQFLSLWEFQDPPIKIQIDFEFVDYENSKPTDWSKFSHSSAWEDLQQGIKGVFHKWIIQALGTLSSKEFYTTKGKAPVRDNMFSFAVSSKEGGGLRAKYQPVVDPQTGQPMTRDGLPVMKALPPSGYNNDVTSILTTLFGDRITPQQVKQLVPKFWSFTGILEIMNTVLRPEEKETVLQGFLIKLYGPAAQGLYKNDPERDASEKEAAVSKMLAGLKMTPPSNLTQMVQTYYSTYKRTAESLREADETGEVIQSKRKGVVHLQKMKDIDFLDLLDELKGSNGKLNLGNVSMNVKVDGLGGRFGKDSAGRPFYEPQKLGPIFEPGASMAWANSQGITDPGQLERAQNYDGLFDQVITTIAGIDKKLGPDFLKDVKVHVEVLYVPMAEEIDGKLKFVSVKYNKLPNGVKLALVPFFAQVSSTGEQHPDSDQIVQELKSLKQIGSTVFIDNSLTTNGDIDATGIIDPLVNLEALRDMSSSNKRTAKQEANQVIQPMKEKLADIIISHPNIVGRDMLGKDYEGIIINSRNGPVKVTTDLFKDVVATKTAAKMAAKQAAQQRRLSGGQQAGGKTAVVAIGSFAGHKGHQELFALTINKAKEVGGDPYLFIGNAVGKDDPIPVSEKVKTWHMLYPQYANNISAVTEQGGTLTLKIKHELIQPRPGQPPKYDNIIIMVGEDQKGMSIANALMNAVNKFQGYEHVDVKLEPTPRGTGVSFTQLRNSLKNDQPEQQLAVWTDAFNGGNFGAKKLSTDWIKHLMNTTRKGMGIKNIEKPEIPMQQQPVAEAMLPTSTFTGSKKNKLGSAGQWKNTGPSKNRPARAGDLVGSSESIELDESNDIKGTLKTITNDIGEPITNVYETMKYMAKRFYDSHGDLKGFSMVAAGVGGRWFQTFYFNRLQNELYDLCKQNTKLTVGLQQFLRGSEVKGKLENAKGFNAVSKELPDILATIGAKIGYAPLANNARRWMHNREEYEQYLSDLELSDYEDDDDVERAPKIPKDPAIGQQRSQVEDIVNDVLRKLPSKVAGDVRNAIARAPNKLQALQHELQKRGVKVPMESLDEACWKGYKQIGMKKKGKRTVPNCVPASEDLEEHKRGVKAMKYTKKPKGIEPPKPRNPVAKNAMAGIGGGAAGAHKNKKREAKHKHVEIGEAWEREMSRAISLLENK